MVENFESKNGTAILFASLRFVLYFLTIFVTYNYLSKSLGADAENVFREGYFVEWLQYSLIMATVALYFFGAWRWENRRALFLVLGVFGVVASIREWDYWWDRRLPSLGWELPASICLFVLVMIGWRNRNVLPEQICDLIRSAPFGFLWSGFLTVVVLAQLVGHAELLKLVMGSEFRKGYKQVIEESLELFGYYLIWFGTLEAFLSARLSSVESAPESEIKREAENREPSVRRILKNRQIRKAGLSVILMFSASYAPKSDGVSLSRQNASMFFEAPIADFHLLAT